MAPTELEVQAYEQKVALRGQRRQARRPAVIAFRNLFLWCALGAIIYVIAAAMSSGSGTYSNGTCGPGGFAANPDCVAPGYSTPGPAWASPTAIFVILAYIVLVAIILCVKNSQGHQIRGIARYRRAALYPGHPWVQFRIQHPYMSRLFVISMMLIVLNILNGRHERR